MPAPELLVFDLDGTLVDSKKDIANAVNHAFSRFDIAPLSEEIIEKYVGTGVQPLIEKTLKHHDLDTFNEAFEEFRKHYFDHVCDYTQLYPNIIEALEHYGALQKVILTNKSNPFIEPLVRKLEIERYFVKFYGRNSFPTQKPDPGPLLGISREFNVAPERMLMIGDTEADILAGKGAKTQTCAVFYGYGNRHSLLSLAPDFTASHPTDLIGLFR